MAEISRPEFEVSLMGREPFKVQIPGGAQVQYELEAAKRGWPEMDKASTLWGSFVCWVTAKRNGYLPADYVFDKFVEDLDELRFVESKSDPASPDGVAGASGGGLDVGDEDRDAVLVDG